ncbi:MAG: hypothetical protein ACRC7I_01330 [Selenomonadaceae bacterium]
MLNGIKRLTKEPFVIFFISINIVAFLYAFNIPSHLRYAAENTFSKPNTSISSVNIGICEGENNYYSDEFNIDDNVAIVPLYKYSKPTIYLYGETANSYDPVTIYINGKSTNKIDITDDSVSLHFWNNIYINRVFVAKINLKKGTNEITIASGNIQKKYKIGIREEKPHIIKNDFLDTLPMAKNPVS